MRGVLSLLVAAVVLVVPASASADLTSLLAACGAKNGVRFCDDGVPDQGGRTPNPGAVKAVAVPAKYNGYKGLPGKAGDAATVPGATPDGNIAIDADLTLPSGPPPAQGYPLVVFMHGCCAGNKTDWEGDAVDKSSEQWHYNNLWFAQRGYAVLTYTARGFVTTTLTGDKGSTGETQIDHRAYEINDFQHLAGQLADNPAPDMKIDPQRVVTVGGSYGGGFGWNALTDPRWRSPAGKDMKLGAVITKYGWTDLAYSLVPTGAHLPGQLPPFDGSASTKPIGMLKRSFTAALFQSGFIGTPNANGSRHATFPPDISETLVCLNANDPSQMPPGCSGVIDSVIRTFVEERSAYYQNDFFSDLANDPSLATPVYVGGTFSDQLFTAIETLRMVDRLRSVRGDYPVQQYFGDYLHAAQAKPTEWADLCGADRHVCTAGEGADADNAPPPSRTDIGVNSRANAFLDHYIRPSSNPDAPAQPFDVTAALYVCKANARDEHELGLPGQRFTAPTFGELAPNTLSADFSEAKTTTSTQPTDDHAAQADPVFNVAANDSSCPSTTTPPAPSVAAYQTEALPSARTMIGLGRVAYRYAAQTPDPATLQLNTRLYDVAPDGKATFIDRGVRRLSAPSGEVTYALHGQGWRFEAGHAVRIEVTQVDDPYIRRSTTPSAISLSLAQVRLPVREGDLTLGAAPIGRTRGTTGGKCRSALRKATVRARGRRLRIRLPKGIGRTRVDVFQQSVGRMIVNNRKIARFRGRRKSFTWNGRANRPGRHARNGLYFVRLRRGNDTKRFAFARRHKRFHRRRPFARTPGCGLIPFYKLGRSVFGGRFNLPMSVAFKLGVRGNARLVVKRGSKTLKTFRRRGVRARRTMRFRMASEPVRRGNIRFILRVTRRGKTVSRTLVGRRL